MTAQGLKTISYSLLVRESGEECCRLDGAPDDMAYSYRLARGVSAQAVYDPELPMTLDPDHRGRVVPDFIDGPSAMLVVSERIAEIFRAIPSVRVEVFPLIILDLKKKPIRNRTWVINPIGWVDCLDRARTEGSALPGLEAAEAVSLADKELPRLEVDGDNVPHREYTRFRKIVLRQDRLMGTLPLFRLKSSPQTIIFRQDLVDALMAVQPSGGRFTPVTVWQ